MLCIYVGDMCVHNNHQTDTEVIRVGWAPWVCNGGISGHRGQSNMECTSGMMPVGLKRCHRIDDAHTICEWWRDLAGSACGLGWLAGGRDFEGGL